MDFKGVIGAVSADSIKMAVHFLLVERDWGSGLQE